MDSNYNIYNPEKFGKRMIKVELHEVITIIRNILSRGGVVCDELREVLCDGMTTLFHSKGAK